MEVRKRVRKIETSEGLALIRVMNVPDRPGIAAAIFEAIDKIGVGTDPIIQNASITGMSEIAFGIPEDKAVKVVLAVGPVAKALGASGVTVRGGLGKVALVGTGIHTDTKYVATLFRALAAEQINIECISTSEIKITCLIDAAMLDRAASILAKEFEVDG